MDGSQQLEDPLVQFDWEAFLDQIPDLPIDDEFLQATHDSAANFDLSQSPNTVFSEIESLLMADDVNDVVPGTPSWDSDYDKLLAEVLISEPPRGESDDGSSPSDKDSDKDKVGAATPEEEEDEEAADEPLSKKQRRQMRNRDAAVRSRERKKLYVKNLEMRSRYYEGECRRLTHLLQCCYAENHALRLCLQSRGAAFVAPMTTQESAVLLLESLLLGSLLWFMGIMCQLSLPLMLCLTEVLPRGNMEQKKGPRKMVPREPESKISEYFQVQSFVKSRKCRASRTKMKLDYLVFCDC